MAHDADYLFALKLQEELNREEAAAAAADAWPQAQPVIVAPKRKHIPEEEYLNATQNLVHPEWENIDPTPDVHSLFGAFDIKFFQGKLKCVELEWSKRMYQCAGICYQRRNHLGTSITIRLSEPLLKLRTRRNLIETLLHEMIHAYLFILNIREGNGGHGPNFIKIMTGINRTAGTNISVYHSFHDEVNVYKTHVWRCNGICQHRKPFFGWVKRTCNRAPGPNDIWWQRHHESCGGVFQKVSEPEPKQKAKKSKAVQPVATAKIPSWAQPSGGNKAGAGFGTKMSGSSGSKTIVINQPPKTQNVRTINDANAMPAPSYVPASMAGSNFGNVIGFKDLNGQTPVQPNTVFSSGGGRPLNGTGAGPSDANATAIADRIRNVWSQKFDQPSTNAVPPESTAQPDSESSNKRGYVETLPTQKWEDVDDDIMVWEEKHPIIDICDDDSDGSEEEVKPNFKHERSFQPDAIKRELFDDLGENENDDVIELIDDEFDDAFNESINILTDTSVINDIFGEDTLMDDFNNINNVVMNDPENRGNPNREIITCPICQDKMRREELTSHLEGCTGITVKVEVKPKSKAGGIATGAPRQLPFYKNQPSTSVPSTRRTVTRVFSIDQQLLRQAGYTKAQIDRMVKENAEEKDYNARIMDEMAAEERTRWAQQIIQRHTTAIATATAPPTATDTKTDAGAQAAEEIQRMADRLHQQFANTAPSTATSTPTATVTTADAEAQVPVEKLPCPVCNQMVNANDINAHLDECLNLFG